MEILSVRFAGSDRTTHLIAECKESDTCPGCGAGYHAGFVECEYCRRPVALEGRGLPWGVAHGSEFVMPASVAASLGDYYSRLYEEEFESSLQRLAKTARMVPRDDGTTGFEFG